MGGDKGELARCVSRGVDYCDGSCRCAANTCCFTMVVPGSSDVLGKACVVNNLGGYVWYYVGSRTRGV